MQYRAPDRSLLEIVGDIDYSAPAIQLLYSPITGTPISLPALMAGSIFPRRWRIVSIIQYPPQGAPTWSETVERLGGSAGNLEDEDQTPLPSQMSVVIDGIKEKLGQYAPWVILAGAGVLYILLNKKTK